MTIFHAIKYRPEDIKNNWETIPIGIRVSYLSKWTRRDRHPILKEKTLDEAIAYTFTQACLEYEGDEE
jgi:hypothetical protein